MTANFPTNPNGQATMANSQPVVLASDQSAVPVTLTSTTVTGTVSENVAQVNGVTVNVGVGAASTGTQRVAVASDSSITANAGTNLNTSALALDATLGTTNTEIGIVTETAPATDTASSGLNGRLQRIAQRLTSLIALLPTALGAGGGLKIDGSGTALPVSLTSTTVTGNVTVVQPTGTNLHAVLDANSGVDIGKLTANQSVNLAQVNGVTVLTGTGATGTGSERVTVAVDSATVAGSASLPTGSNTIGALTANQSVNTAQIAGVTTATGTGVMGTGVQRVAIASDNDALTVKQATAANLNATVVQGTAAAVSGAWTVKSTDGTTSQGFRPDGYSHAAIDPTTLLFDTFETLDTTNTWTTGGTSAIALSAASGVLTVNAGTPASATSYLTSKAAFTPGSNALLQNGDLVTLAAGATTGAKAVWGLGTIATTPTALVPLSNGAVFEVLDTDGLLYGAVYSNSVRTQQVALTRPTDGGVHRYSIYYKASKVYFELDNVAVGSIAFPNPAVGALNKVIGVFNGLSILGSPFSLTASLLGVADTGKNSIKVADGQFPWRQQTVKQASTAALATDLPAVVAMHPSSPLPAGTNIIGVVQNSDEKTLLEDIKVLIQAQTDAITQQNLLRQLDNRGREIVTMGNSRGFLLSQTITITASTTETTLITGGDPGTSYDIYAILVTNTSASTVCRVDIRDFTGGPVRAQIQSVGGTPTNGISLGGWLLPQLTPGGNWTATCGTSTTDIRITVLYTKNN